MSYISWLDISQGAPRRQRPRSTLPGPSRRFPVQWAVLATLPGQVSTLPGRVSTLPGQILTLAGQTPTFSGPVRGSDPKAGEGREGTSGRNSGSNVTALEPWRGRRIREIRINLPFGSQMCTASALHCIACR